MVTLLRLTSEVHADHLVRVTVRPTPENGLRAPFQVMIDRAVAAPHERIGAVIYRLDDAVVRTGGRVGRALAAFLGLATIGAA